jgi:hypothetical protein
MQYFVIRNWHKFQHYKDRNPPWIKLHYAIFSSQEWVMLDDSSKLLMVVCMLIASQNEGRIPNSPEYVKRVGNVRKKPNFKPLLDCGFLEILQADASAAQAGARAVQADAPQRRGREEAETDAEGQQEGLNGKYFFRGEVIKLNEEDYRSWQKTYHGISDLSAELTSIDGWLVKHPEKQDGWFFSVPGMLNRKHQEALLKKQSTKPTERKPTAITR